MSWESKDAAEAAIRKLESMGARFVHTQRKEMIGYFEDAFERVITAEREACARAADLTAHEYRRALAGSDGEVVSLRVAAAIRARRPGA